MTNVQSSTEITHDILKKMRRKEDTYTEDHKFHAYKFVDENLISPYFSLNEDLHEDKNENFKRIEYALNTFITHSNPNTNDQVECGEGIHVCTLDGAKRFKEDFEYSPYNFGKVRPTEEILRRRDSTAKYGKIIKVSFRKKDIAAIPEELSFSFWLENKKKNPYDKFRLRQCFVEEVVPESDQEKIKAA